MHVRPSCNAVTFFSSCYAAACNASKIWHICNTILFFIIKLKIAGLVCVYFGQNGYSACVSVNCGPFIGLLLIYRSLLFNRQLGDVIP